MVRNMGSNGMNLKQWEKTQITRTILQLLLRFPVERDTKQVSNQSFDVKTFDVCIGYIVGAIGNVKDLTSKLCMETSVVSRLAGKRSILASTGH